MSVLKLTEELNMNFYRDKVIFMCVKLWTGVCNLLIKLIY